MSDLIDRRMAIEAIMKHTGMTPIAKLEAETTICRVPSAEPERKKGKWENYIADTGVERWRVIRCSECGKVAIHRYNYCPHCGSDMREEKDA